MCRKSFSKLWSGHDASSPPAPPRWQSLDALGQIANDAIVNLLRRSPITSPRAARFRRKALAPDPRLSPIQESEGREAGDSAFGLLEVRPVVRVSRAEPSD
jgi:hypothetical protein